MALKFAMILEAVDRMSGPAKRASAGARQLAKGARELAREGTPVARAMDRVSNAAGRMRARLGGALIRVRALAGRLGMKALEKAAYGAGYAIGWTIRKVATLALGLAKLTAGAAGLAGGAFLGGVIATTAKFEQFQIMLEGTEGSAEKAKKAMDWVRDFAKKTPYELEQVMQAFVKLKGYGLDPLDGSLVAAGDAAAGMSKDLLQAVEALADAQTGEFERLKEFGIRARVEGNKVAFTYMKNGKEIRRETTNNAAAMKDAITGIWSDRFGGSMERQSKTFNGMISNLKDGWSDFMLRVGQAGVFDKVKAKLQGVLDWLNARLADKSIDRWADIVSKKMETIVDWLGQLTKEDLDDFVSNVGEIADGFIRVTEAIGWTIRKLKELIELASKANMAFPTAFNVTSWAMGKGAQVTGPRSPAQPAKPAPMTPAERARWQGALGSPRGAALNLRSKALAPGAGVLQRGAAPAAPSKVAVGGKLEVELKAPPGWTAVPTRMSSVNPGVPVAFRGKANGGYG